MSVMHTASSESNPLSYPLSNPLPPPLVRDPVGKTLLSLTLPAMWGVMVIVSAGIVDTLFARELGLNYQAALSFTSPVTFMLSSVALGLAVGTASITARSIGAGNLAQAQRMAGQALLFALGLVTLVGLIAVFLITPLFTLLGASQQLMPLIQSYMGIYLLSAPALVLPMVGSAILRANGNAIAPSMVLTLIAVIKGLATPALMYGWGPLPRLELAGAALASSLAFSGGTLMTLSLLKREELITFEQYTKDFVPTCRKMLFIGLPSMATNVLGPVCIALATKLIAPLGAATVAGFGIANRIEALVLIPLLALSGIIGPFMGQNLGAKRYDRMQAAARLTILFSMGYGLLIALAMAAFAPALAHVFSRNTEVITAASLYLYFVPLSYTLYGVIMIGAGAFNGLGDPRGNIAFYGTKSVLYLTGVVVGEHIFGYNGVCTAIALANVAGGLLALHWLRQRLEPVKPAIQNS
jgi:putative MATE family efflux protein